MNNTLPGEGLLHPEDPGRAALNKVETSLRNEALGVYTVRQIQAILNVSGDYYVDVECGTTKSEDPAESSEPKLKQHLSVTIGHHNSPAANGNDPEALLALLSATPPSKRIFGYGQVDGDLTDEQFNDAMTRLAAELPPATMAWVEQAMATAKDANYDQKERSFEDTNRLMDVTQQVPSVEELKNVSTYTQEIRFVGGWHLSASWSDQNEAYTRQHSGTWLEPKQQIRLYNPFTEVSYWYTRDVAGGERVIFESSDPDQRFTSEALGYEAHAPGDWEPTHREIAEFGVQQPSDGALGSFAHTVEEVMSSERIGPWDIFVHELDDTIRVHKVPDKPTE